MRDLACGDCVVAFLAGPVSNDPSAVAAVSGGESVRWVSLSEAESRAFAVLATSGLVPPLRLTRAPTDPADRAG